MRLLFVLFAVVVGWPPVLKAQTRDQRILAAVVAAEAADQGTQGMLAVAEVIRARSVLMRRPPVVVVQQRNKASGIWAFSCLNRLGPDLLVRRISRRPEYKRALAIARKLTDDPAALGNLTRGATFFTRKTETPRWARGEKPVLVLGDHAFYRLPFP